MNVSTFEKTLDLLHRGMDAQEMRRQVIANNIANSGVPNFKRSDLNFESELKRALASEEERPALELTRTDPRHMADWEPRDYKDVKPRKVLDFLSTANNNGNNVNPEEEFMLALENQMRYSLMAQAMAFEFSQVNLVLRG
ncbi:MAG: flagellar basal body rod protein FlgB [Treponema sp.]|jgi:flagellar basal-body rod protein FlgB|nr:flagellar basal body rod protein FlgB [Treponema sp.]